MSSFVYLATVFEVTVVKNIGEDEWYLFQTNVLASSTPHIVVIEKLPDVFVAGVIFCIELEGGKDHSRFLAIQRNSLGARVIQISHWSGAGEVTLPRFGSQATSGIYA